MLPSLSTLGRMTQTGAAKQPRALVFGLGAIGGIYAAILKRSNACDVSVVARSTYDGVRKHGLKFNSEKHGNETAHFGDNGGYPVTELWACKEGMVGASWDTRDKGWDR